MALLLIALAFSCVSNATAQTSSFSDGQHLEASTQAPLVALASSFRALWSGLMEAYQHDTDADLPRTSFASSGLLATQIRHGAPFELFLSADPTLVEQLQAMRLTRDAGVALATGSLSLVSLNSGKATVGEDELSLDQLAQRVRQSRPFKVAMPNPRHAPYGVAARQALESIGLWPLPAGHLLSAENASQSLQFALSGAVDYALVPTTLVVQPPQGLSVSRIDARSYVPVVHQMVLLHGAGSQAVALYEWLQGSMASRVLAKFGLTPVTGTH